MHDSAITFELSKSLKIYILQVQIFYSLCRPLWLACILSNKTIENIPSVLLTPFECQLVVQPVNSLEEEENQQETN